MLVFVCVRTCVCVRICMCLCVRAFVRTCVRAYVCLCVYVCVYVCVCVVLAHLGNEGKRDACKLVLHEIHTHTYIHTNTHTCVWIALVCDLGGVCYIDSYKPNVTRYQPHDVQV